MILAVGERLCLAAGIVVRDAEAAEGGTDPTLAKTLSQFMYKALRQAISPVSAVPEGAWFYSESLVWTFRYQMAATPFLGADASAWDLARTIRIDRDERARAGNRIDPGSARCGSD